MSYYLQLIESYLRLHEKKTDLDPQAVITANKFIQQGKHKTKQQGVPVPGVGTGTGVVWQAEEGRSTGKVVFNGFPGTNGAALPIESTGRDRENSNYIQFVKLFYPSKDQSQDNQAQDNQAQDNQGQTSPEGKPAPPTEDDLYSQLGYDAEKMYDILGFKSFDYWLNRVNAKLPSTENLMMKILRMSIPAADDSEEAKAARDNEIKRSILYKDGEAYQILNNFKLRFGGTNESGSLAKMLANHVMIVGSVDGKQTVVKSSNQELISATYDNLQKIMVRVSNLVRKKETISAEECKKFKDTIVPMQGSRIYFNDRGTNTGIIINDKVGSIRKMFSRTLESAGCGLGETKSIGSIAGAAAQIRGAFSESVQRLVIQAANCVKLEGKEQSECSDKLGEIFEEFKDKKDLLVQSLKEYSKVLNKGEASIPIGEENSSESLAYSYLFDKYGDEVGSVILKSLVSLAKRSYMERQPDSVSGIGKDTKFGKKGDTLELWNDKERFIKAMEQYGISRESAEKHMIVTPDGKFGADISLKNYVTLKDGISLGSISENTLKTLISGKDCGKQCSPEEKEQYRLLREGIAASLDQPWMRNPADKRYKALASIENSISNAESKIDGLSENTLTTNAEGEEINVDTLKKFVTTLKDQMRSEFNFSDIQESGLLDKMERYLKEGKNPNQMKSMIKNFVRSQMLNKYSKSTNPEEAQAYKDHLLMSEFAAGGSRNPNTLITANGIDGQDQFTGRQNDLLDPVIRFHRGELGYSVSSNIDGSETTYYGPGTDGNIVPLYKASTTTSTSGRRSRGSHVEYNAIKNARARRKPS